MGKLTCGYCNSTAFEIYADRKNAVCVKCEGSARQRCLLEVLNEVKTDSWQCYSALHLSDEPSIKNIYHWFDTVEQSIYEFDNSIDLTNIDRGDDTYNIIFCSHILEHIEDDVTAIREMLRVLKPGGTVFIMVPQPEIHDVTQDWGFPDPDFYDHYRVYGKDFITKLENIVLDHATVTVHCKTDIVFGKKEIVYQVVKHGE